MTGLPTPRAVTISPMRRRHLRAVLRIETQVYPTPWSMQLYLGELDSTEGRTYRVARSGQKVVGYGGLMYVVDEAHVTTLAVHPEHQGYRIGARILLELTREAIAKGMTALTLEVRASNLAGQALYRRFGLVPAGIRRGYYREVDEDAIIMWAEEIDGPAYGARLDAIEAGLAGAPARGGPP